MSENHDLASVITVDWEAVEASLDTELDPGLRRVIEHAGDANPSTLDKWGYAADATTALDGAVNEHGRVIHPERGPLDARYAPLWSMRAAISTLKTLRGGELTTGPIIEDGDDSEFLDGLADLYVASRELDARRADWHEGQYPHILEGNHGPDRLGDLYVRVGHVSGGVIKNLDLSDLPVEREHVRMRPRWGSEEEHYTASLRHERYYSDE